MVNLGNLPIRLLEQVSNLTRKPQTWGFFVSVDNFVAIIAYKVYSVFMKDKQRCIMCKKRITMNTNKYHFSKSFLCNDSICKMQYNFFTVREKKVLLQGKLPNTKRKTTDGKKEIFIIEKDKQCTVCLLDLDADTKGTRFDFLCKGCEYIESYASEDFIKEIDSINWMI